MNWVEKYRPKNLSDVKGQEQIVSKLREFLNNFPKKKSIILHGPAGVGKTSIAIAAAKEKGMELFELNASDFRDKKRLNEVLKPAIEQKSLTENNKLILIDEVDGISGKDRGGIAEIIKIMQNSAYPLIITANNIWDRKFNPLRQKSETVQIKELNYNLIKEKLIDILRAEKKFIPFEIVKAIAIKARGDLRSAINDIQTASDIPNPNVEMFSERNKDTDIFNSLRIVFKEPPTKETLRAFDNLDMPIDEIILWVEENIPREYQKEALARAIQLLAKTDLFKGRIYKQQYWRFLVYENIFLSYGVSSAKKNKEKGFTSYKKPSRILKIWLNNQKMAKKKSISEKYAKKTHTSTKAAMKNFPYIKPILNNPEVQKEIRLDEDEVSWIEKEIRV